MYRTTIAATFMAACFLLTGCLGEGDTEDPPQLDLQAPTPISAPAPNPPTVPPPPPLVQTSPPLRVWTLLTRNAFDGLTILDEDSTFAAVDEKQIAGGVPIVPAGFDANADVEAYSNASGKTYWVSAEAPHGDMTKPDTTAYGAGSYMWQVYMYRKESEAATLQLIVSAVDLQVIDYSDRFTHPNVCPWIPSGTLDHPRCFDQVSALVDMDVFVQDTTEICPTGSKSPDACKVVDWYAGAAQIAGYNTRWTWNPGYVSSYRSPDGTLPLTSRTAKPIFRSTDFTSSLGFVPDIITTGQDGRLTLARNIVLNLDISEIKLKGKFTVTVKVRALAHNRQAREAYARAMLRDPVRIGGVETVTTGLTELAPPETLPAIGEPDAPQCEAPIGVPFSGGGVVQFGAPAYTIAEFELGYETIFVERVGSSIGKQVVTVTSSDGTAIAGEDYDSVRQQIVFHDGDNVPRAITIPVRNNANATGDSALTLELSAEPNCGVIGARRSTVVTIVDDDQRQSGGGIGNPPPAVTLGGSVVGLAGSGLVLEDRTNSAELAVTANGNFTFARNYSPGTAYDVRIKFNPTNPAQVCSVTNGVGTTTTTATTDILVNCATPAAVGSLDPTFGDAGKFTSTTLGAADQIELQSDGKIVALISTSVRRFLPNGSPDASFGSGGLATVNFGGGGTAIVNSITLQPDGKILVTGSLKRTAVDDDIAVTRLMADGTLDASFGSSGTAFVVNADNFEQGVKALVQADGRIVVASTWDVPPAGQRSFVDFAVVRLGADGVVDNTFGTNGRTVVDIAGRTDLVKAAALQADGRIVVVGRVAASGSANPDLGVVRFHADGTLDTAFASNGILRRDVTGRLEWDEPEDVAVQADGRIVVAMQARFDSAVPYPFSLVRFEPQGSLDTTFGTDGVARTAIGTGNALARALALQADGKIVVVGQVASATVNDFGIVRYLATGALDLSFDGDGILLLDFFAASDSAADVAIQSDGKLIAAGTAQTGGGFRLAMVRVIP
jgi:uncharacterized delta-60 repeat protein